MDNNAMVILNIGKDPMTEISLPPIREICKKYNWSLEFIDEMKIDIGNLNISVNDREAIFLQKFQIVNFLERYDRIVYYDRDVILSPQYPNVFEEVPKDNFGLVNEDTASSRTEEMDIANIEAYYNCGFMVISKCHIPVLIDWRNQLIEGHEWVEQTTINKLIQHSVFPIKSLSFRYNHLTFFSNRDNGYASPLDSYAIHYAGCGGERIYKMKFDKNILWGDRL